MTELELPSMFDDDSSLFDTNSEKLQSDNKANENKIKDTESNDEEINDTLDFPVSISDNIKDNLDDLSTNNVEQDFIADTIQALIDDELENIDDDNKDEFLKSLLEGVDVSTDTKSTKEDLKKVVENISNLKSQISLITETSAYSEEIKKAILLQKSGGNPADYFKTLATKHDITSLDVKKESDQEQIIRLSYRDYDLMSPEDIEEKIEDLKNLGLLEKEASKLKPSLDKKAADLADNIVKEQQMIAVQKQQLKNITGQHLVKEMSGGIKGVKLTNDEINQIAFDLLEERDFQYGKNKQSKKVVEYMLDYNLYAEKGDRKRAILAYMVLNPNFDKKIEKIFSIKEIDKFIADHEKNTINKFKVSKTTTEPQTQNKFKFKINK